MRLLTLIAILGLAVFYISNANAVRVNSLYRAEVPVISQTPQDKTPALTQGLREVFVKVSGNLHVVENNPGLKPLMDKPEAFVQEFSYAAAPKGTKGQPYRLLIKFDAEAVNQALGNQNIPIWGQSRPLILAWIAAEGKQQNPEIIDSASGGDIQTLFKQEAKERGLPLIFPMMDMTDINLVTVDDIVKKSFDHLQGASSRYKSDGLLIGHIVENETGFNSAWQLNLEEEHWNWDVTAKTMAELLTAIADNMADTLAERYAVAVTTVVQGELSLIVSNITNQVELIQLMQYLQHLNIVSDVQLQSLVGTEVTLIVFLHSNPQALLKELALSKNLKIVPGGFNDANTLHYKWLR